MEKSLSQRDLYDVTLFSVLCFVAAVCQVRDKVFLIVPKIMKENLTVLLLY